MQRMKDSSCRNPSRGLATTQSSNPSLEAALKAVCLCIPGLEKGVGWHLGIALALGVFKWLEKLSTDKLCV